MVDFHRRAEQYDLHCIPMATFLISGAVFTPFSGIFAPSTAGSKTRNFGARVPFLEKCNGKLKLWGEIARPPVNFWGDLTVVRRED